MHLLSIMMFQLVIEKVEIESLVCQYIYRTTRIGDIEYLTRHRVIVMSLYATFNNLSVISWLSFLLVDETGKPRENHRPVTSHRQTLSHNAAYLGLIEIRTRNISGSMY